MKKILLLFALCVCALQLNAQNRVEFLGMQINGNTKTAFAEKLKEKGYKFKAEKDGFVMYTGQFLGLDASVMLVPSSDEEDGINGVHVFIDKVNPVKLGQLYADLLQKYMAKYSNYKYTTEVGSGGGTEVTFTKKYPDDITDFVALTLEIRGSKCKLIVDYGSKKFDDVSGNSGGNGIGIDDI